MKNGRDDLDRIREALQDARGEVRFGEPMSRHTSMRVGGPADALFVPDDLEDLSRIMAAAGKAGVGVFFLGGSNLIVKDGGIRGVVIKLSRLQKVERQADTLNAEAGISFPRLSQAAYEQGLSGLEFACGIPGTLGGAIAMNAGTRDGEIADVLHSVTIMDRLGNAVEHPRSQLTFEYRKSRLPEGVIVRAIMQLKPDPPERIRRRMDEAITYRRRTQPLQLPNAGCIFKNPPGHSAGRLIDEMGLKGTRSGNAQVSEKHANFIVNRGSATAAEVLHLIQDIRRRVKEGRGVDMELEVTVVGEDA